MTARVHLTRRALLQIDEIDRYSIATWGERVPAEYQTDIHSALTRLESAPGLVQQRPQYSVRLRFYRVREHTLVCDVIGDRIYVLAIWDGAMDFAEHLAELEPQLVLEAEVLARRVASRDA